MEESRESTLSSKIALLRRARASHLCFDAAAAYRINCFAIHAISAGLRHIRGIKSTRPLKQAWRSGIFMSRLRRSGPDAYIIPPMPAPPAGIAGVSSLMLATTLSVVSSVLATLVAFCRALLVTFAGSRMPALTISTYSSFRASKPTPTSDSRTLFMITLPSSPAFAAM